MDAEWRRCALQRAGGGLHSAVPREVFVIALIALLAVAAVPAPMPLQPSAEAVKAFDEYVARAEERIRLEESSLETFIAEMHEVRAGREGAMGLGRVVVDERGAAVTEVPGGLIHHWMGTVFIPGATVGDVLAVVEDYDHLAKYYGPEVVSSRLISRDGEDF